MGGLMTLLELFACFLKLTMPHPPQTIGGSVKVDKKSIGGSETIGGSVRSIGGSETIGGSVTGNSLVNRRQ